MTWHGSPESEDLPVKVTACAVAVSDWPTGERRVIRLGHALCCYGV